MKAAIELEKLQGIVDRLERANGVLRTVLYTRDHMWNEDGYCGGRGDGCAQSLELAEEEIAQVTEALTEAFGLPYVPRPSNDAPTSNAAH